MEVTAFGFGGGREYVEWDVGDSYVSDSWVIWYQQTVQIPIKTMSPRNPRM
jgi:hypothetical protein